MKHTMQSLQAYANGKNKIGEMTQKELQELVDSIIDQAAETGDSGLRKAMIAIGRNAAVAYNAKAKMPKYSLPENLNQSPIKIIEMTEKGNAKYEAPKSVLDAPKIYEAPEENLDLAPVKESVVTPPPATAQAAATPAPEKKATKPKQALSDQDVKDIKQLLWEGIKPKDIAIQFNVHPSTVSDIKVNRGRYGKIEFTPEGPQNARVPPPPPPKPEPKVAAAAPAAENVQAPAVEQPAA